jgi:hypothetical protein
MCMLCVLRAGDARCSVSLAQGGALTSASPLFFELVVEESFPISESTAVGALVQIGAVVQIAYLLVPVNQLGTAWENWALCAVLPVCLVGMLFWKVRYQRTEEGGLGPGDERLGEVAAGERVVVTRGARSVQ